MTKRDVVRFQDAVAESIRNIRTDHGAGQGMSQGELAKFARVAGLNWTRSTVADIEKHRRDVSVEEFLLLPVILNAATNGRYNIELETLFPRDMKWLDLGGTRVKPSGLAKILSSRYKDEFRTHEFSSPAFDEVQTEAWSQREAEVHAARVLGIEPTEVTAISFSLWDQGLTEEREERLAKSAGAGDVSRRRGHITRKLIAELENEIERKRR